MSTTYEHDRANYQFYDVEIRFNGETITYVNLATLADDGEKEADRIADTILRLQHEERQRNEFDRQLMDALKRLGVLKDTPVVRGEK